MLPEYYFGNGFQTATSNLTATADVYSAVEQEIKSGDEFFAGELVGSSGDTIKADASNPFVYYTLDDDVICKVCVELPPFMSAFEVGTSFFNAKSLTTNHYLTWGHNELEYLKNYPFINYRKRNIAFFFVKNCK